MGVIFLGDRGVGKTHLAVELANPKHQFVKVANLDYSALKTQIIQ